MGLTITIGSLNKFTVIIIAIAVGIDLLINRKFKGVYENSCQRSEYYDDI